MAFFNKLFSSSRRKPNRRCHPDAREKLFTFSQDQVRVTVFRECDFRGRKLLFDSHSVEKILVPDEDVFVGDGRRRSFMETRNGYGYLYTKPSSDVAYLGELIFGSVGMSYRGTSYKIHSVANPNQQVICSMVFPSPRNRPPKMRNSAPSHIHVTSGNVERSIRLEDSGTSSATSCSDQSVLSTASDTLLVCKRTRSVPLDVPVLNSSLISSSGYGGDQSMSSISSGPQSIPIDLAQGNSCSGNLSKRWARTATTSLDRSLCNSEDHQRYQRGAHGSKIGLAIIVELGLQESLEEVLMEHAALIDSLLWRVRSGVEEAYVRHSVFVSSMFDIARSAGRWFVDLFTGAHQTANAWHSVIANCDSLFSITAGSTSGSHLCNRRQDEYNFFSISRFLRTSNEHARSDVAETFVRDLCELIEGVDTKHTNFFMSTLVTAVLTHHLGWVATSCPDFSGDKEAAKIQDAANPLWGQLTDLFGATGHPSKMSHTIITGPESKSELISKILKVLTYFIRCAGLTRRSLTRSDVEGENRTVDVICQINSCIPKENYKRYEDYLREIIKPEKQHQQQPHQQQQQNKHSLKKTKSNLNSLTLDKFTDLGLQVIGDEQQLIDITEAKQQIERVFSAKKEKGVIFVLGDDEKLIGLKEDDAKTETFPFKDSDFFEYNGRAEIKPSTSYTSILASLERPDVRAQSEPPELTKVKHNDQATKYRYSGVKFNLKQYPQIVKNYMQSKNIELSHLSHNQKKELEDCCSGFQDNIDFSKCELGEPLTTPSNASELEFTSDLVLEDRRREVKRVKEVVLTKPEFVRTTATNKEPEALKLVELPMPMSAEGEKKMMPLWAYTSSLMRGVGDHYVSDMVLQGTWAPKTEWEAKLKRDLISEARHPLVDQTVDEAVAVIGNVDTWNVHVMSSHTYVIDRKNTGVIVGMSQLVANMLESLLQMWRLRTPAEYCILHIEQRLQEFCMKSKAMAQMLLTTDFCSMELLTSALKLEVNDVPLLMAIASTHSPQVTQKYGICVQ
ncbi:PREDICTED: folliculin-interacting protein 2 [Nicrophorus vespilloides]|uniref:Folliculin-interacting protein 2 n=1 Tax=Nicrophorus vespilloides TaxID=110193 RepID=A0ABM1NF11_NICVS|nr:PREDICTED: folliculin-interacting protein 2 [Nicrophorus vespilloides]